MSRTRIKITSLTVLFILTLNLSNAQFGFGKIEDIKKIKEIPLLVMLASPNANIIKKVFEEHWLFSKKIKFIAPEDFKSFNSKKSKDTYAYIKMDTEAGSNRLKTKGLITTYHYSIYLSGNRKSVFSFMYPSNSPNEADLIFIIQQIQYYLKHRELIKTGVKSKKELLSEMNEESKNVEKKTLLIDKNSLSNNLRKKIKSLYPFDYKITSKEEIDLVIIEKNSEKCYLKITPLVQITKNSENLKSSNLMYSIYIINPENGDILAHTKPIKDSNFQTIYKKNIKEFKPKIKVNGFKKIIKKISQ